MLKGQLPETMLRDAVLGATRRYAKRQETWFRNQLRGNVGSGVWALDATEDPPQLANRILERWPQRPTPHSPHPTPLP